MIEALRNLYFDENPCIGCTSTACHTCACEGERDTFDLAVLKAQKNRVTAPKKPAALPEKDAFLERCEAASVFLTLPETIFGELESAFVLLADGDGMKNAGILSGDQIIFERSIKPSSGDIVVGRFNGTLLCMRIFFEGEAIRVRREDGETPDIITSNYMIFGIMVGLARNCRKAG